MRVLGRLYRQNFAGPRQRERECAQPGEQIGDRRAARQPFAHRADECRLAIGGRLREPAGRQRHRHAGEGNRHRLGLPLHLRPIALVERQPGQPMAAREIEQALGLRQSVEFEPLDFDRNALVRQRQMNIRRQPLARPPRDQRAQRGDQREQIGVEHVAFAHVDDLVRPCSAKADPGAVSVERRPAA